MQVSRRLFSGAMIGGVAASLAACSGGGSKGSGSKTKEVILWGGSSDEAAKPIFAIVDKFNASQDEYKAKYVIQKELEQKLLTGLASGQVPDVVIWDRWMTSLYAPKKAFVEMGPLLEKDNISTDDFYDQALRELTVNDKIYGLPFTVDNRSLFYNEELLDKAGVKPPTNWDELLDVAVKTTQRSGKTLKVSGFMLDDVGLFNMWIRQAGGRMISEDMKTVAFNSPEGLSVLNFWRQMMDEGVYELGFGKGGMPFPAGQVAQTYTGPWSFTDFDKAKSLKYGVAEPPAGPKGDKAAGMGGHGLVLPAGSKNQDGGWAFIKWMADKANALEYGKISGQIPGNRTAANDDFFTKSPKYGAIIKAMDYATVRPEVKGYSDVEGKALIPELQKFMSKQVTAEQALAKAEELGNKILKDNAK